MQLNKKYYSISEVGKLLNLPNHRLRYLEKISSLNLKVHKVQNRRYYTKEEIQLLLPFATSTFLNTVKPSQSENFINKIESLIIKFQDLHLKLSNII